MWYIDNTPHLLKLGHWKYLHTSGSEIAQILRMIKIGIFILVQDYNLNFELCVRACACNIWKKNKGEG